MERRLEQDLEDLLAARRAGEISIEEFEAVAAYLTRQQERAHTPAKAVRAAKPVKRSGSRRTWYTILAAGLVIWIGGKTGGQESSSVEASTKQPAETATADVLESKPAQGSKPVQVATVQPVAVVQEQKSPEANSTLDKRAQHKVCKGAIAALMSKPPHIISTHDLRSDEIEVVYFRQDDNTRWAYKCLIQGNRVLWGSYDGRWRTHELDEWLFYDLEDNGWMLSVTAQFGGAGEVLYEKSYHMTDL